MAEQRQQDVASSEVGSEAYSEEYSEYSGHGQRDVPTQDSETVAPAAEEEPDPPPPALAAAQPAKKVGFARRMRRLSVEAIGTFASKLGHSDQRPPTPAEAAAAAAVVDDEEQAAAEAEVERLRVAEATQKAAEKAAADKLTAQRRREAEAAAEAQAAAETPAAKALVAELHAAAMAGDSAWIERLAQGPYS